MGNDQENILKLEEELGFELYRCEGTKSNDARHDLMSYTVTPTNAIIAVCLREAGIASFPTSILNLKNLRVLDLYDNDIAFLPSDIGQLANLEILILFQNRLTTLPSDIGKLKRLWLLDLGSNKIHELPNEIGQLQQLQRLYLRYNELTSLPSELHNLKKLITVDLEGNSIPKTQRLRYGNLGLVFSRKLGRSGEPETMTEMLVEDPLSILKQDIESWNKWRASNPAINPKLIGVDLSHIHLGGANLSKVDFSGPQHQIAALQHANLDSADLSNAVLVNADLSYTNLAGADLSHANLSYANLSYANLTDANLYNADLSEADLDSAHLIGADLTHATLKHASLKRCALVDTKLNYSNLTDCHIYGISAWNVSLEGAKQTDLVISSYDDALITVDNLEVAQFIYLLMKNEKIRDILTTLSTKTVLILGRFTKERKATLDAIREELRKRNYVPILFDFEKPKSRDLTETLGTLAHMARFILADLTDAKSIPQELATIVPFLPSVPVQPLILRAQHEYAMFEHWSRYPWVLPIHEYESQEKLVAELISNVIQHAEVKASELHEDNKP